MAKGLLWPLTEVVRRSDAPSLFYLAFENLNVLLHDGRYEAQTNVHTQQHDAHAP
jgi:hypothetical protein